MSLLMLPAELRLHIYAHLTPDLGEGCTRHVIRRSKTVPAICQTSQQLRSETLPIYFTANFEFHVNLSAESIVKWTESYDDNDLALIRTFQLNRHWSDPRPHRGVGHQGFYIRLVKCCDGWGCIKGTFPLVNDSQNLRIKSVLFLCDYVLALLDGGPSRLAKDTLGSIARAADVIVASEPTFSFALSGEQSFGVAQSPHWARMESQLRRVLHTREVRLE